MYTMDFLSEINNLILSYLILLLCAPVYVQYFFLYVYIIPMFFVQFFYCNSWFFTILPNML